MAPEKSPAFQFYPKEFLTDGNVAGMSLQERGAYITLICLCWHEQSLPADPKRLANMIGVPGRAFARLWPALAPCFFAAEGRLVHPRLEKERLKQESYRRRQSDAGKASAANRAATVVQPTVNRRAADEPPKVNSPISDLRSPRESLTLSTARVTNTTVDDALADRAAVFLQRYDELYRQHRHGAQTLIKGALDFDRSCSLCAKWPNLRLEQMAGLLLTTDEQWVEKTDRGFGVFFSRAAWCDDRLTQFERKRQKAAV